MNRAKKRIGSFFLCCISAAAFAAQPAATPGAAKRVALPQPPAAWAGARNDLGEVDGSLPLTHLSVILNRPADRQAAFEELLREQQDPASPNYHKWLTPLEVGERYGVPQATIEAVKSWLVAQGLHVDEVSNSRVRIRFGGAAASVAAAFGARLHSYALKDGTRIAPSAAPTIPAELAGAIGAVHGLKTIHARPQIASQVDGQFSGDPQFTNCTNGAVTTCTHVMWPADFAAIYNVNGAYGLGANGSGQTIAIVGRSNVNMADIENFQAVANLPKVDPVVVIPPGGIDPGPADASQVDTPSKDQSEATLDVTRAGSVAVGAAILLVVSKDSATVDGIAIASQYVVDTNPVPARVMSISFGDCESDAGAEGVAFVDNLFSQAAAEGISVFVSSGDSGAAGCDDHTQPPPATQVASPNFICASSHATCVGGTEFADTGANQALYWNTTNAPLTFLSAKGYIPEGAWNEPTKSDGTGQLASTGGGVSAYIATPSWQTVTGVPGRQGRYTPDISFSAAAHDGYLNCFAASGSSCVNGSGGFRFVIAAGTSASAPSMAGVAAILNQKMGAPQGNLNPGLYALAASASTSNTVFHDVTVATSGVASCDPGTPSMCNNSTPSASGIAGGLRGYSVGTGFDLATGLGSLDVGNLVAHWTSVPDTGGGTNANYQGLWWASPAGSESGWGINFAHQGDTIFATWFTYDLTGAGNWLVMTAPKTGTNTYSGTLFSTTGPAFSAVPFSPAAVTATSQGTASLTFSDANTGTFSYTVNGITQTKAITRDSFGPIPTCGSSTALSSATNYTDLWWNSPAASESGWGINLTHEGTTIFASWFTYDTNGKAMWLVATAPQTTPGTFTGDLFRTSGPAFNAVPFNPANVVATKVGSASFTFADGNHATFAYTVNGISQSKQITRDIFGTTSTVCH